MLQQTQVAVVVPYFERFVAALPDVRALAAAPQDDVLALWSGLGYYARARNLHAAARACVELHDGDLPRDFDALLALPGIGRSTAGAILSQAWGDRFPILDGNVKRVLARWHGVGGWPGQPAIERVLWAHAASHLPHARMADYTQAQMDLGATVCVRHAPHCLLCPVAEGCIARREGRTAELPTPRPGKALPERQTHMLVLEDDHGRILLQRRPSTGIWAALWSLPEADDAAAAQLLADSHARLACGGEALAPVPHGFSHYRLLIHPRRWCGVTPRTRVGDNDDLRWVSPAAFDAIGMPAPIRRLLEGCVAQRPSPAPGEIR